jgi:hypothetical protein
MSGDEMVFGDAPSRARVVRKQIVGTVTITGHTAARNGLANDMAIKRPGAARVFIYYNLLRVCYARCGPSDRRFQRGIADEELAA